LLQKFSGCDQVELWFREDEKYHCCQLSESAAHKFQVYGTETENGTILPVLKNSVLNGLRLNVIRNEFNQDFAGFSPLGSFLSGELADDIIVPVNQDQSAAGKKFQSLALIPLLFGDERIGFLQLMSYRLYYFTAKEMHLYEDVGQILGIALINQRAQAALRERVKELSCLYSIAQIAEQDRLSPDKIVQKIVELIPPAWQYPDITRGRIVLDGKEYSNPGYTDDRQKQTADIRIHGRMRGSVDVTYLEEKPEINEGPFLEEERKLIDTIAKQVGMIIEKRESEKDRSELQEQLRHADRLATIGQLAAGVAHELNEPLGNILGFAQLAVKSSDLPDQARQDIEKIIGASLNSREIIKKLMLFARQVPPHKTRVNLNQVVQDGLYFFEARCAGAGIELIKQLTGGLPDITGDQAQLNQVLVNLVVNSIQAMPDGGKLVIKTGYNPEHVSLVVEDSGTGMPDEVLSKIFIPFFTTKEVNEGTGLGLAVVHGIVTSHKGSIKVKSKVGEGSRFEVQFALT
jgi:signal transduction histidine kinase